MKYSDKTAREYYLSECLPPYRARDYEKSKEILGKYFKQYSSTLSVREKLMAHLAMVTSVVACLEKKPGDALLKSIFFSHFDCYFQELALADLQDLAPEPFLDFFSICIRFFLQGHDIQAIVTSIRSAYTKLIQLTSPKMRLYEYLDIWIKEIHNERRNLLSSGRMEKALALTTTLVEITKDTEILADFNIEGERIMADILYFSPAGNNPEESRYREVIFHLDNILRKRPDDLPSLKFKRHINELSGSMLQIRRFQHDTGTTLGNLTIYMDKLKNGCPKDSNLYPVIIKVNNEIQALRTVTHLVTNAQPSLTDWEEVDISEIISSALIERNFPKSSLTISGEHQKWECCPNLVSLVLRNLIKNSLEAYGRNCIPMPEIPMQFYIEYDHKKVYFRDYAGGVDLTIGDIFEPYRSSKGIYSNVGLGLTQARKAMQIQDFSLSMPQEQPRGGALFLLDFTGIHIPHKVNLSSISEKNRKGIHHAS